ncbi:MAG TPA: hypothetical protein VFM82_01995 [Flavobacteriaceae bacterium]|nr:hypothetical protein [Flavobacteriaceae bacterium]
MIRTKNLTRLTSACVAFLGIMAVGCSSDDSGTELTNPEGQNLTLQFQLSPGAQGGKSTNLLPPPVPSINIEGSNGTLVIEDIRFILEDIKLEQPDSECEDSGDPEDTDCEELEMGPFFVDMPLNGNPLDLGTTVVADGLYDELEFEIDNLDSDDPEDTNDATLLAQIQNEFPNWPNEASMLISGHFTSTDGVTTDFSTYAEAEVEIELNFNPALEITPESLNNMATVNIDPANWFLQTDGSVTDLSLYDYAATGEILEFSQEIEDGFESVESDDDHDSGDNDDDDDDNDDNP